MRKLRLIPAGGCPGILCPEGYRLQWIPQDVDRISQILNLHDIEEKYKMAIEVDMMKKVPVAEQDPLVRARNFDEVCLGYKEEEARAEGFFSSVRR